MSEFRAYTRKADGITMDIRSIVGVDLPLTDKDQPSYPILDNLDGLWDTGATGCAITKRVVDEAGLEPISIIPVSGVHGTEMVECFLISLYLPNLTCIKEVQATILHESAGCDVLIGMSVIALGDFAISNLGGQTQFTFRVPSAERFDFRILPKDNHPCPCRSGSMYKNCCKKLIA